MTIIKQPDQLGGRVTPRAKSETAKASARTEWLQLRASVNYIEPPVWRRLQIPGSLTLGGLHHVLQTAFGWTDSHLHRFSRGRTELGEALVGKGLSSCTNTTSATAGKFTWFSKTS